MPITTKSVKKNFYPLTRYMCSACMLDNLSNKSLWNNDSELLFDELEQIENNYDKNVSLISAVLNEEISVQNLEDALSETGQQFLVKILAGSGDADLQREEAFDYAIRPHFVQILELIE